MRKVALTADDLVGHLVATTVAMKADCWAVELAVCSALMTAEPMAVYLAAYLVVGSVAMMADPMAAYWVAY